MGREISAPAARAGCRDFAGAERRERTPNQDSQLTPCLSYDTGHESATRTSHRRIPFANHREQDGERKERKNKSLIAHFVIIVGLRTGNRELPSKSHNVISAIHVNHFSGDAAACIRGEKDSSR